MKRNLLHVLATGALALTAATAQLRPHATPDPATMATRQVDRLAKLLTLTTAQQSQATSIFTNAAITEAAVRTNLRTAQTALQAAITKNDTASIDNLSSQIGSFTGQELDSSSKAQAAFYSILTADQQAKYTALHGPGGMGGPGGMHRGGGPEGAHFGPPRQ